MCIFKVKFVYFQSIEYLSTMKIQRNISTSIIELIGKYPVIALTGPRQSGKTTLLKSLFKEYEYVNLENPEIRSFAQSDPNGFLSRYHSKVILDEAQRVPHLFSFIQAMVDESGEMGEYILSGSQNFHLMQEITQSLAGRVAIFRLFPFDFVEMGNASLLEDDPFINMIRGFYPALYDRDIPSSAYYSNYIQTYVQRDVSEIIGIKNLNYFQNFLKVLATRAGQLLNLNDMARQIGISQPTAKSWLSALENSYIVFCLQPYFENFSKRIIKSPKLYFYDTGLLSYLLSIRKVDDLLTSSFKGNLFENLIIANYVKKMHHLSQNHDIWFWRDSHGNEIDLVFERNNQFIITEIKASKTINTDFFKGLNYFERIARDKNLRKQVVYAGDLNQDRTMAKVLSWKDL